MAVGKGSMARASKAADQTSAPKATKAAEATKVAEPVKADNAASKEAAKKVTAGAKRTTTRKTAAKAKNKTVTASTVVSGTSKEVMHMIEYQKSSQVLDREPEANETFGVGEAMPIYFF